MSAKDKLDNLYRMLAERFKDEEKFKLNEEKLKEIEEEVQLKREENG